MTDSFKKGHPVGDGLDIHFSLLLSQLEDNREGVGYLNSAVTLLSRFPLR